MITLTTRLFSHWSIPLKLRTIPSSFQEMNYFAKLQGQTDCNSQRKVVKNTLG